MLTVGRRYIASRLAPILLATFVLLALTTETSAQLFCGPSQELFDENGVSLWESGAFCLRLDGLWTATPTMTETPVPTDTPTPTSTLAPTATFTQAPTNTAAPRPPTFTPAAAPTFLPTATVVAGTQRHVGVGQPYSTIGSALVASAAGDTILVHAGTYPEKVTIVGKTGLTIQSAGDGPSWIDGGCVRANGIEINGNDVTIRGLGIKKTTAAAILIGYNAPNTNNARATIEGNTLQDYNCTGAGTQNSAGIAAWYAGGGHRIVGNTITRRVEVAGAQAGQGNGIWVKNNSGSISGGGYLIAGNVITGGYDGIGGETEGDTRGAFDRDSIIERNTIRNCADDGIQIDGGGMNVVVQDNVIEECGSGVSFAAVLTGPATVRRNTISSSTRGYYGTVICFKIGRASTAFVYVENNVCRADGSAYGPNIAKGMQQTNAGMGGIIATGNRYTVSGYVYELGTPLAGSRLDDACLESSDPTRFVKWAGVVYTTLASFQAATGQELNAVAGPC